nr:hypothetical protein [Sphingomonas daechungensis]
MYSQNEIDEAVSAGAITPEAAGALRSFVEGQRSLPTQDEEQFRLITGFNDIFVSIAAAILLFAVGWIGQWIGERAGTGIDHGPSFLAPAAVAAVSWSLALFFTARRRMALPSILLLLAFVGGVLLTSAFVMVFAIGPSAFENNPQLGVSSARCPPPSPQPEPGSTGAVSTSPSPLPLARHPSPPSRSACWSPLSAPTWRTLRT